MIGRKIKRPKFKTTSKIKAKFKTSRTASVLRNCPAYSPPPQQPPPPTEEPCAPSNRTGPQITPNSDRNYKEGNPNSSLATETESKDSVAGAGANADDDELDFAEDRAFDGERRRTKSAERQQRQRHRRQRQRQRRQQPQQQQLRRRKLPRHRYPAEYLSRGSDLPQQQQSQAKPSHPSTGSTHRYSPHPCGEFNPTHSHTNSHAHTNTNTLIQRERKESRRRNETERKRAPPIRSPLAATFRKYVLITV